MTAPIRTSADMIDTWRSRIRELGLTHATVDALSGLPDGYCSKLMCGDKKPGSKAIELMNGALAVVFTPAIDQVQAAVMQHRWTRRVRPLKDDGQACRASMPLVMPERPAPQHKVGSAEFMKRIGQMGASKGGKRRAKVMKKRARQRAAQHAARKRWGKAT